MRKAAPVILWHLGLRGGHGVELTLSASDTTALFVLKGHATVNGSQRAGDAEPVLFERQGEPLQSALCFAASMHASSVAKSPI